MRAIRNIIYGILALFGFIIVLAVLFWMDPGLLLTSSRVNHFFFKAAGDYFSKRPDHLTLSFDARGWNGKRVLLDLPSFCLKEPDSCFDRVHAEFIFRVTSLTHIQIEEVGPIIVHNQHLTYQEPEPEEEKKKEQEESTLSKYVSLAPGISIRDINIRFPKLRWIRKNDEIDGDLNIQQDAEQAKLHANANINDREMLRLRLNAGLVLNAKNPLSIQVHFSDSISIDGELDGNINWTQLAGDLRGQIQMKGLSPWIPLLTLDHFKLTRDEKVRLKTDIEVRVSPKFDFAPPRSALPRADFRTRIRGKIEATNEENRVRYIVKLGPFQDQGISGELRGDGIYPVPKARANHFGLSEFFFLLEVPKFQNFVQSLKKTSSAIPAPFSTLQGSIRLQAGNPDREWKEEFLPLSLVTQLNSKEQIIQTESNAKITLAPAPQKIKIVGESNIQKLKFTFPNLKILEPAPEIRPDPRIKTAKKQKELEKKQHEPKKRSNIDLQWKVTTAPAAIQFFYPVLKPYASLEGQWVVGKGSHGEMHFLPFEIEYLNRRALVKQLRFFQEPGQYTLSYDGVLQISKADYVINILINRVGEKPVVQLQSEPPLPEGDIISLILFNQTSSELDPDQTNSVASTQAAVANRALGLFSIFALSNTPVEAVSFNPSTGVYSARVRLASGLTATVGTNWENTQEVALRKRLGKNFILSTVLSEDEENSNDARRTMIEWFRRF